MRTSRRLLVLSALLLAALGSIATASDETRPWTSWASTLHQDHPLTGTIWSVRDRRIIRPADLAAVLARTDLVLLGEVHDNPDHHRLQGWMIDQVAGPDTKPAVVMEMIRRDQSDRLAAYVARPDATAAGLGAALEWDKSGWPAWKHYQPIAEAAFRNGLTLLPGDPERSLLRRIGTEGVGAIGEAEAKRLQLLTPLGRALSADLLEELYLGHCELVPKSKMKRFLNVQRARDAVQADQLLQNADARGGRAILIAGNGHVRADRGVPWYLRRRAPGKTTLVVQLIEVDPEADTAVELIPAGVTDVPVADYIWFTPRQAREDPCEALRQRLKGRP